MAMHGGELTRVSSIQYVSPYSIPTSQLQAPSSRMKLEASLPLISTAKPTTIANPPP